MPKPPNEPIPLHQHLNDYVLELLDQVEHLDGRSAEAMRLNDRANQFMNLAQRVEAGVDTELPLESLAVLARSRTVRWTGATTMTKNEAHHWNKVIEWAKAVTA